MKHLLILVMIISLLLTAVGCSNGLVSSKDDLSGGDKPALETTPEASPDQNEPENNNSDDTGGQKQNEPETPEVVPSEIETPEVEQKEPETQEVETPEENQSEKETPEVEQPVIETPEVVPPIEEPPEVEPPIVEPPETEPPIIEPQEINLLQINELRTEPAVSTKRAEFIEFKAMRAGNLNGISVHIMNDAKKPYIYYFPDINVALGEYITLHLRTLDGNCKDELGDNLSLSGGTESCATARDLWVAGNYKYLNTTDIVYLQDASGKVLDAVVLNKNPSGKWEINQEHFAQITEFLFNAGAWESKDGEKPTPYDAVDTSAITNSNKSVCRYEWRQNHFNTTDWYINAIIATPGLPNN